MVVEGQMEWAKAYGAQEAHCAAQAEAANEQRGQQRNHEKEGERPDSCSSALAGKDYKDTIRV